MPVFPLLEIQEQIAARCPGSLRILLYRRFMLGLAERIARRFKAKALITGESLGQVASQTIENLAAVELIAKPDIDGGLIGGASLKAEDFLGICKAAN